jgi:8-oxo-dGTP diphosphatase
MKKTIEVVAAVIQKDGLYFCAQRPDRGELANKWEFPGGKIEHGETPEKAIKREIKEELDTDVLVHNYMLTVHHEYNTFIITLHAYQCSILQGNLELSEHISSRWVSASDMIGLDFAEADKPIIEYLLK